MTTKTEAELADMRAERLRVVLTVRVNNPVGLVA